MPDTRRLSVSVDDPLGAKYVNRQRATGKLEGVEVRTSWIIPHGFGLLDVDGRLTILKFEEDPTHA